MGGGSAVQHPQVCSRRGHLPGYMCRGLLLKAWCFCIKGCSFKRRAGLGDRPGGRLGGGCCCIGECSLERRAGLGDRPGGSR